MVHSGTKQLTYKFAHPKFYNISFQVMPYKGQPWPLPQHYAAEPSIFTIDPDSFKFSHSSKCDIIIEAVKRYQSVIFIDHCKNGSPLQNRKKVFSKSNGQLYNLTIQISGPCEKYPHMNMDEQCKCAYNSLIPSKIF